MIEKKELRELEDAILTSGVPYRHVEMTLDDVLGYRVDLHAIATAVDPAPSPRQSRRSWFRRTASAEKEKKKKKKTLLCVHGAAGGSALGLFEAVGRMATETDGYVEAVNAVNAVKAVKAVHCVDLPGFGRSTVEAVSYSRFRETPDAEEAVALHVACLREYIRREIGVDSDVVLVGHSFGAFLCARLAEECEVECLIMVSGAGVFPFLGAWGWYWAAFFKARLPGSAVRALPAAWTAALARWLLHRGELRLAYRLRLVLATDDRLEAVDGFIRFTLFDDGSFWTAPLYARLMRCSVRLGLVYGERDSIMPPHQGLALARLCRAPVPVAVVRGARHAPHTDDPAAFREALRFAIERACYPSSTAADAEGDVVFGPASSLFPWRTARRIREMYDRLAPESRQTLSPAYV